MLLQKCHIFSKWSKAGRQKLFFRVHKITTTKVKDDFCFSFFFNFSFKFCTLCNEISWQVNLSRLYFPWIFRWSYFNSFWLHLNPPFVNVLFAPPSFLQCQIRLVIAKLSKSNTEPRSFSFFLPRLFHPRKVLSGKLDETLFRSCPAGKSRKEAAGNPYWIPLTSRGTSNSTRPSLGS